MSSKGRIRSPWSRAVLCGMRWRFRSWKGAVQKKQIEVFPMFGEAYEVPVIETEGGHGGADPILLNDLFGIPEPDPFNRAASHIDGALSILTGIAANKAIATGLPVKVDSLIKF